MKDKYIIVEGKQDQRLLAAILPELSSHIKLVAAEGYSAALSKAATVLSYLHQDTLLVLDAGTSDDQAAAEKEQFVYDYLKSSRNGNQFALVLFKPTLLDQLLGREQVLTNENQVFDRNLQVTRLWRDLETNPTHFAKYQELPTLQRIIAFAQA